MAYQNGYVNKNFVGDSASIPGEYNKSSSKDITEPTKNENGINSIDSISKNQPSSLVSIPTQPESEKEATTGGRDNWGKDIEFLLSCIALSVGLGNVWRFPFTALENGGGAFVIPYIIVLFLVGKPVYYMEMILGQFSSRGSVKVFDFSPIMRGVGYGQVLSTAIVTTYYASLMALTIRYFFASFHSVLPWSYCREEWKDICIDSLMKNSSSVIQQDNDNMTMKKITSAELYFMKDILKEKDTIHDGIGYPSWELSLCLALSWSTVALVLIKGVKSSGKASYFLAIFPYIVMGILLVRALTLPGAINGVIYFLKPQWDQLLNPKVWYAAVTQVFFSLAVCFGNIIMYASYNRFAHNVYKDATIITSLDTMTSLLAGIIIFGVLGNLAYETNTTDISKVVKGGSGLAFVSYPDAIAKFEFIPQVFSMLFFIMLFVLGIGSNIGMASCVMTVIRDRFPFIKHWLVALMISVIGFCIGLIYLTPGGQYILNLLDFYGASFVALVLAVAELIAIGWIYGVNRLCKDIEFMLGISTGIYWRLCWSVITPAFMTAILVYNLIELEPLKYRDYVYPDSLYIFGWCVSAFGILQLPFWGLYAIYKQPKQPLLQRISSAFKPQENWGPIDPVLRQKYKNFLLEDSSRTIFKRNGFWNRIYDNIFG